MSFAASCGADLVYDMRAQPDPFKYVLRVFDRLYL
jgi:hypothetical protein